MIGGYGQGYASSVSISGERLAVGVPEANTVHVYIRQSGEKGGSWVTHAVIRAPVPKAGDRFGAAVALDGWTLLVGAPGDDDITDDQGNTIGTAVDRGACYVFEYQLVYHRPRIPSWAGWVYKRRVEPGLPAGDAGEGARFGSSVALSRGLAVVGAPHYRAGGMEDAGGVFAGEVLQPPQASPQRAMMQAAPLPAGFVAPNRRLGRVVAVRVTERYSPPTRSSLMIATAPGDGDADEGAEVVLWTGTSAGASPNPTNPVLLPKPPGQTAPGFGASAAIIEPVGDLLHRFATGVPGMSDGIGGAQVMRTGRDPAPLSPGATVNPKAGYGAAVAYLQDGTVLVGSANADQAQQPAAPVIGFRADDLGVWKQALTLPPRSLTGAGGHGFGSVMSASGSFVAVAAPAWPSGSLQPLGAVIVYDLASLDSDMDTLLDSWERSTGLDTASAVGDNGAQGDPDKDGVSNEQEYAAHTHPRAFSVRYFAEGSSGFVGNGGFATAFVVANPGATTARVQLRLIPLPPPYGFGDHYFDVPSHSSVVRDIDSGPYGPDEFSAVIESDLPVVADREMRWMMGPQGGGERVTLATHAERSVQAPSATWYFAEGASHSGLDTFFLLANFGTRPSTVRATYLRPDAPLEREYLLPPQSRTTVWADFEEFPAGSGQRALTNSEFGATFTSIDDVGFVAERAMYVSRPGLMFLGGHASAGVTAPATRWLFAEGATGTFFDEFLLLANPGPTPTRVRLTYLLPDGQTRSREVTVGAHARFNVWVDYESFDDGTTFPLSDVSHSTVVESLNGIGIIAERAMWWQSAEWPGPTWSEGHNAFGATETGSAWMSAFVRGGPPAERCCEYLLVANPNEEAVTVRLTLAAEVRDEDGSLGTEDRSWDYTLPPQSRLTIPVHTLDATLARPASPARVEVLGDHPRGISVEQASYDAKFQAGSCRLLTKVE